MPSDQSLDRSVTRHPPEGPSRAGDGYVGRMRKPCLWRRHSTKQMNPILRRPHHIQPAPPPPTVLANVASRRGAAEVVAGDASPTLPTTDDEGENKVG